MRQEQDRKWLVVITVLLAAAVAGLWTQDMAAPAAAEDAVVIGGENGLKPIEGSAAGRQATVMELVKINQKLDAIGELLTSGQVKVIVVQDEKKVEEVRDEAATQP